MQLEWRENTFWDEQLASKLEWLYNRRCQRHNLIFFPYFPECSDPGPIQNGYRIQNNMVFPVQCGSSIEHGCYANFNMGSQGAYWTCEAQNRWGTPPSCLYSMYPALAYTIVLAFKLPYQKFYINNNNNTSESFTDSPLT